MVSLIPEPLYMLRFLLPFQILSSNTPTPTFILKLSACCYFLWKTWRILLFLPHPKLRGGGQFPSCIDSLAPSTSLWAPITHVPRLWVLHAILCSLLYWSVSAGLSAFILHYNYMTQELHLSYPQLYPHVKHKVQHPAELPLYLWNESVTKWGVPAAQTPSNMRRMLLSLWHHSKEEIKLSNIRQLSMKAVWAHSPRTLLRLRVQMTQIIGKKKVFSASWLPEVKSEGAAETRVSLG